MLAYHYMTPSVYPGGPDAYEQHAKQQYPYGYAEAQLDQARQVMEQAGYGPNNTFDLTFTIYQSATWDQTAKLLRDQLRNAHVQMEIQQVTFSSLLERVQQGTVEAFSLGWIVPWAAPDAFVKHLNPAASDTGASSPEAYNNWPSDLSSAQRATSAWDRLASHPEPTDEAERIRNDAAVAMEKANWEGVCEPAGLSRTHESVLV